MRFKNLLSTHASTIECLFVNALLFALELHVSQMAFQNRHLFQVFKRLGIMFKYSVIIKHIFFV
jgi:hypothetical protein